MEQQAATMNEVEQSPSSELAPVAQEAAAETDLLTTLERRWEAMSATIRDLRSENGTLREQLRERDEKIANGDQETVQMRERLAELMEEKKRTIERVESLLARFDDSGR